MVTIEYKKPCVWDDGCKNANFLNLLNYSCPNTYGAKCNYDHMQGAVMSGSRHTPPALVTLTGASRLETMEGAEGHSRSSC